MDDLAALVEQVPDEILDYIEDLETRVEKAEALVAGSTDEPEDEGDSDEGDPIEKALNSLPPEVAEMWQAQSERLVKAEQALEAERLAKADAEWTQKTRSIDGLVDNPEEFGPKLRAIADADPELAESIVTTLQAANSRVAKGVLFSEIGHGAPVPGSALEKAQAIAKAQRDAEPSMSIDEALAKVWETHPDLYDQYTAEQRAAVKQA